MAISGMGSRSEPIKGVEPSVLAWARQSLGLSLDDVALKLKKPVATIASWETGDDSPSYAQLEKLAYDVYHRPLATFFSLHPQMRCLRSANFELCLQQIWLRLRSIPIFTYARGTRFNLRYANCMAN